MVSDANDPQPSTFFYHVVGASYQSTNAQASGPIGGTSPMPIDIAKRGMTPYSKLRCQPDQRHYSALASTCQHAMTALMHDEDTGAFVLDRRVQCAQRGTGPAPGLTFAIKGWFNVAETVTSYGSPGRAAAHTPGIAPAVLTMLPG